MIYYSPKRTDMANKTNKLKVYDETSFVCYLTGDPTANAKIAADQAYTRQWWNIERERCDVFASKFVVGECEIGKPDAVARRKKIVRSLPRVAVDDQIVATLSSQLIAGHALPEKETTDALHIAAASVAGMDVLLTWNCRHMANLHTLPKTREIIEKAGYRCPWIMTPKAFLESENLEVQNA